MLLALVWMICWVSWSFRLVNFLFGVVAYGIRHRWDTLRFPWLEGVWTLAWTSLNYILDLSLSHPGWCLVEASWKFRLRFTSKKSSLSSRRVTGILISYIYIYIISWVKWSQWRWLTFSLFIELEKGTLTVLEPGASWWLTGKWWHWFQEFPFPKIWRLHCFFVESPTVIKDMILKVEQQGNPKSFHKKCIFTNRIGFKQWLVGKQGL